MLLLYIDLHGLAVLLYVVVIDADVVRELVCALLYSANRIVEYLHHRHQVHAKVLQGNGDIVPFSRFDRSYLAECQLLLMKVFVHLSVTLLFNHA